jgi:hypothetical protein
MHLTVPIDIRFVGLPGPCFQPRWRCNDDPALRVIVGHARAVQQALASTPATTPRLALVVGRGGVVDCADLVVRVPDLREARRACGVLVSLATPRAGTLIDTDAHDLATIVRAGRGGDGLLLRRRGDCLVDAAMQVGIPLHGATPHALVVRTTTSSRLESLADHNEAMRRLGDVDDHLDTFILGVRDAPGKAASTIELLAALRRSPAIANDDAAIR